MLDQHDLTMIADIMNQALTPVKEDISFIKKDIVAMKADIVSMKDDIASLFLRKSAVMPLFSNRKIDDKHNVFRLLPFQHLFIALRNSFNRKRFLHQ